MKKIGKNVDNWVTFSYNFFMLKEIEILNPVVNEKIEIPLCGETVQAGFPSPAEDYLEDSLDLNEHLIDNRDSTFFVRVAGMSMVDAGIRPNDILIVDKSLIAKDGNIVIAVVNDEFTVKRLAYRVGRVVLKAENKDFKDLMMADDDELIIWGVVTSVIHKYV